MAPARNRLRALRVLSAAAVAGVAAWAAVDVVGTATNQCDNLAGTCLHDRQKAAILAIQVACVVAAAVSLRGIVHAARRAGLPRWWPLLLVAYAAIAVSVLAVDPLHHLNNRWDGWLGGHP